MLFAEPAPIFIICKDWIRAIAGSKHVSNDSVGVITKSGVPTGVSITLAVVVAVWQAAWLPHPQYAVIFEGTSGCTQAIILMVSMSVILSPFSNKLFPLPMPAKSVPDTSRERPQSKGQDYPSWIIPGPWNAKHIEVLVS